MVYSNRLNISLKTEILTKVRYVWMYIIYVACRYMFISSGFSLNADLNRLTLWTEKNRNAIRTTCMHIIFVTCIDMFISRDFCLSAKCGSRCGGDGRST